MEGGFVCSGQITKGDSMTKLLIIHGLGMNMRGKVDVETFGPMTLPEYDQKIGEFARELGVEVRCFPLQHRGRDRERSLRGPRRRHRRHSDKPRRLHSRRHGLGVGHAAGADPSRRGAHDQPHREGRQAPSFCLHARAASSGFGILGYYLAMKGVLETYGL